MDKNKLIVALFICSLFTIIYVHDTNYAHGNSFGAQVLNGRGYTGSPLDNRACNVSGCHNGSLNTGPGTVEISTDIPQGGYKAGNRYSVTAKITQSGRSKFGFQITAENNANQKSGRFLAGSETRAPSDFFVTHGTSPSSSTGSGTKSWTFSWDAPDIAGEGPVTLYAAFNGANGNGSSSGDNIYTTSLTIAEDPLSTVEEINSSLPFNFRPNPVGEYLEVTLPDFNSEEQISLSIFDMSGRKIIEKQIFNSSGSRSHKLSTAELQSGVYVLYIQAGRRHSAQRLLRE